MSRRVPHCFNSLFFTESTIAESMLLRPDLVVPIHGVFLIDNFPGPRPDGAVSGRLIFTSALNSSKVVTAYIGNPDSPDGFGEPHTIDETYSGDIAASREYAFEGFRANTAAWLDWTVRAGGFVFELDEF